MRTLAMAAAAVLVAGAATVAVATGGPGTGGVDAAGGMGAGGVGAPEAPNPAVAPGVGSGSAPSPALTGPLAGYTTHIVATHYLRDRAYETHHYFKPLRDGVLQGLVFRETADGAPLVEVEWAIAPEVWEALPNWQKDFWHPLAPAVDAGRVRLPGLAPDQERETLAAVRTLRAQTLNLAGLDGELPVGLEGVAMVSHLTWSEMRAAMGGH